MLKYRNSLREIVKQYFPNANVSFVFTVPCRLNRFFNVKDVTPLIFFRKKFINSSVVAVMLFMSTKLTDIFMLERTPPIKQIFQFYINVISL